MKKLKHIGIAGVTAEGASLCYKTIVSEAVKLLGPNKHPEISLNNISFEEIVKVQLKKDWQGVAEILLGSIHKLKLIGADFAIIPANSIHYAFPLISNKSPLPLISLVKITVNECVKRKFNKVAVMGIGMTMSDGLYEKPLKKAGIAPLIPSLKDQNIINTIIYHEIVKGITSDKSVKALVDIIQKLKKEGTDGVILGCTELPIVINNVNSPLPFIDTTRLLAQKALAYSINSSLTDK